MDYVFHFVHFYVIGVHSTSSVRCSAIKEQSAKLQVRIVDIACRHAELLRIYIDDVIGVYRFAANVALCARDCNVNSFSTI